MDIIRIIGCGGHARSVADILFDNNPDRNIIFYDEKAYPNEVILKKNFLGGGEKISCI